MNRFFKFISLLSAIAVLFGCSEFSEETGKVTRQIKLSKNLIFVDGSGKDNIEITVNSEKDWTASPVLLDGEDILDWVTLSQTEGKIGETKLTLNVAPAAEGEAPRSISFHFVIDKKNSDILTVRQEVFSVTGVRLMGAAVADKPLDNTLNVSYSGVVEPFEAKISLDLAHNLVKLDAIEFIVQFEKGAGVVKLPLTGKGLKVGDETMTVKIENVAKEFSIDFHIGGYVKIKDIIAGMYPPLPADGSRGSLITKEIKEDVLIKGIVVSAINPEGKARPTPVNEIVIQDSKDPKSAIWIITEGKRNHGFLFGTELEINLKQFNMTYNAYNRRLIKNQGGVTNEASLRKIADPDPSKVDALLTRLTKEEFLTNGEEYESMYVQIDDVDIAPGEIGKLFKPADQGGNYGFIELVNPMEGNMSHFALQSSKACPWAKETVEKAHIPHFRGYVAINYFGGGLWKYCVNPQRREDFVME